MPLRLLVLAGLLAIASPSANALGVGKPAPPLAATLLDGQPFSLAQSRGDVVLVNFWATWCEPCMAELAAFRDFTAAHPDSHLRLLAVSMDDPEQRAKVDRVAHTMGLPVAMAADVRADGYGRIWRLPMSFVVDRTGVLRVDGGIGQQHPYDGALLERTVAPLLTEPAPGTGPNP